MNSIENFAKSWTRAAGFLEVTPHRPAFILSADPEAHRDEEDIIQYGRTDTEYGRAPRTSLLRQRLEASSSPENAIYDESVDPETSVTTSQPPDQKEAEEHPHGSELRGMQGSFRGTESIFAIAPHLATPLAGSYGTSYGTLQSTLSESSMIHAGQLWRQQQSGRVHLSEGEREPLVVKEV